jgi:hypothetical protein
MIYTSHHHHLNKDIIIHFFHSSSSYVNITIIIIIHYHNKVHHQFNSCISNKWVHTTSLNQTHKHHQNNDLNSFKHLKRLKISNTNISNQKGLMKIGTTAQNDTQRPPRADMFA